jgi:predicted RNA-binding protein with TRAM domain
MTNTIETKEFGRYRVRLVLHHPVGYRVMITDIKKCDRVVVKIEAQDGARCFASVTQKTIDTLTAIVEAGDGSDKVKHSFARSIKNYIYGTINMISEKVWFNPHAAETTC